MNPKLSKVTHLATGADQGKTAPFQTAHSAVQSAGRGAI